MLHTQSLFYKDTKAQLEREVAMLKSLDERENEMRQKAVASVKGIPPGDGREKAIATLLKPITEAIGAEAGRGFSIYANPAQTTGYEFQAHLVQTQALPRVEQAVADIASERDEFGAAVSEDVKGLIRHLPRHRNWKEMAKKVDLTDEYNYN